MNITRMKLNSPDTNICAYFVLTIGVLRLRNFKLIKSRHNGKYKIVSPNKQFTNRNGVIEHYPLIEITNPEINAKILKLALKEYEIQKEIIKHADTQIEL
jgi:hypothetical protein